VLNLAQVKAFVAVVDAGGFQEAAKLLALAQPTVSEAVQRLEATLGATLVVRSRAGCVATDAGRQFLPHARNLLRAAERAMSALDKPSLVVGASGNIGTFVMPSLLRGSDWQSAFAKVEFAIAPNPELAERLAVGSIDLGLMEWWDDRPGFQAIPWRSESLVVIVAPEHPWAERSTLSKDELLEVPLIGGEPGTGTGTLLRRVFGEDSGKLQVSMGLGSTAAVKEAVKAGWGISLVFASAVRHELHAGTLRALTLKGLTLEKPLFIVLPAGAPTSGPAWRFARHLAPAA
jgi:DNA-binding transcriptional LysR family regulator